MLQLPIYLDYQSTTPIDPRVLEIIKSEMEKDFGNAHSRTHSFGWKSEEIIEQAREYIANVIGAEAKEMIFTSGATESNNLAIQGIAQFYKDTKNHIITVETEHKCIINSSRYLSNQGFDVTFLPVQSNGLIDLDLLRKSITPKTVLISVMAVNNEIGVIQPLKEIGRIARENGVFFHTDAAQAFGKIPLDVNEMNIDAMSVSAHKIYGPKGVGALYVRRRPRVKMVPLMYGGGHERGLRSGTLPTPIIAGFGEASRIAKLEMNSDAEKCKQYFDIFHREIIKGIPEVYLNGDLVNRIFSNINISFRFIEGESMIMAIKDLAVSSGSACTSSSLEPSYVIKALGVDEELAHTSIRFGFGRFTTIGEIEYAIKLIKNKVEILREMSPLWEMFQDGIDISKIEWKHH